jgi:hypothetical protein
MQTPKKHMEKCSTTLATKEVQIKTTPRFHLTPSDWQMSRKQIMTNVGEDIRKQELYYTICGNLN